ncbi:MAG: hypothetical protein A6D92_06170 [Symbiobacterium thermophilum]|uniref:Uncharacterized protein n=1 Tax=Symbiobacterium thermophilum TaxID=2734 RepID=A0A1Y2T5C3_SYMTR|nr:MAG: hypothetical protein A6D92_06170 [Symbiobacterium thermophilum]
MAVLGDPDLADLAARAGYRMVDCCADADLVVLGTPSCWWAGSPPLGWSVLIEASTRSTTELAAQVVNPARVVGYGGIPRVSRRELVEVRRGCGPTRLRRPRRCVSSTRWAVTPRW